MRNTIVSHINIRAYYATMKVLLLASVHVEGEAGKQNAQDAVKKAVEVLGLWWAIQWMQEPLDRVHYFVAAMSWGENEDQI